MMTKSKLLILIYRPIPNINRYSVSITGVIFDSVKLKYCKTYTDDRGYIKVNLVKDGKSKIYSVHRIVAKTWIPNPLNLPVVAHIDNNPRHNWVNNLRWSTQKDNCLDYHRRQLFFVDKLIDC
jgi:hypothetical protein